jgi:hypothetical protein
MMVKKMLAAPAALVAAESGAAMLPIDITIVMIDIRTLLNVSGKAESRDTRYLHDYSCDICQCPVHVHLNCVPEAQRKSAT